jgi:hypothetical protein
MFIVIAAVVAAAMSPLGIDVVTADGHRRLVPVADADATAVEVCAWSGDSDAAPVCAPVVTNRHGWTASVNVADREGLRFTVRATRFDARSAAPAALAAGLGVTAVGCVVGALAAGSVAASVGVVAGATLNGDVDAVATNLAVALWLGAGSAAVLGGLAAAVAVADADVVEELGPAALIGTEAPR